MIDIYCRVFLLLYLPRYVQTMKITQSLKRAAQLRSKSEGLIFQERRYSYLTLLEQVKRIAGYRSYWVGKWHQGLESQVCVPYGRGFRAGSFGFLGGEEDHVEERKHDQGETTMEEAYHSLLGPLEYILFSLRSKSLYFI